VHNAKRAKNMAGNFAFDAAQAAQQWMEQKDLMG